MSVEPGPPPLRALSIVASRGTSSSLFQIATLVRAATALDARVDVLFRDAALAKLRRDRIDLPEWSPTYAHVMSHLESRLRAAEFTDMESFLRDAKQHGDDAHFWACRESLEASRGCLADFTPLLDGVRSSEDFQAQPTDALLRF